MREALLWGAFKSASSLSRGRGSLASALAAADSFAAPRVGPDPLPISTPSTLFRHEHRLETQPTTYDKRGRRRWDVGWDPRPSSPSLSCHRGDLRGAFVSVGREGLGRRMAARDRGSSFCARGDAPHGCMRPFSDCLEKTTGTYIPCVRRRTFSV